jgi:hypothetical protein
MLIYIKDVKLLIFLDVIYSIYRYIAYIDKNYNGLIYVDE